MKTIITLLLILSCAAVAQNPNLGTAGAKFLQIPVGSRGTAMGGAFIGTTNDASSVFWNPAGTAEVTGTEAQVSFVNLYSQFDHNAAVLTHSLDDIGTLSLSFVTLSMAKTEITTEEQPNGTGRFYDAQDIAIGFTYARKLTAEFNVGVTAKYIRQRIWNETADALAFDIGTQYSVDFSGLVIAMSMTNFGSDLKFDGEDLNINYLKSDNYPISRLAPGRLETNSDPLPLHFQVGVAMDAVKTDFLTVRAEIDATHPSDNDERINVGTEANFLGRFFLRGGYRFRYDDETFTFGGGLTFPFGDNIIRFDYAYANFTLLPDLHRYTIAFDF
jgi:hypothetical protein